MENFEFGTIFGMTPNTCYIQISQMKLGAGVDLGLLTVPGFKGGRCDLSSRWSTEGKRTRIGER